MPPFGRVLAKALKKTGMSQSEFARRTGVTQAFISQIVHGHSSAPDSIEGWAETLNIPAEERDAFALAAALSRTPRLVRDYISHLKKKNHDPKRH